MVKPRIDETGEWVRCGRCGQRLFRVDKGDTLITLTGIEIKCHSCKAINSFKKLDKND